MGWIGNHKRNYFVAITSTQHVHFTVFNALLLLFAQWAGRQLIYKHMLIQRQKEVVAFPLVHSILEMLTFFTLTILSCLRLAVFFSLSLPLKRIDSSSRLVL